MEILLSETGPEISGQSDEGVSIKKCQRCGVVIAKYPGVPWHSFISIKWCPKCRKLVRKKQFCKNSKKYRWEKRLERQAERTMLDLLETENRQLMERTRLREQENILLRQQIIKLGGKL